MAQFFYIVVLGLFIQTIRSSFIENFDEDLKSDVAKVSPVKVVTDPDSSALLSLASYGVPYGLDVDIMNGISLLTGYRFQYEYAPFEQLLPKVKADINTVSISTEFATPEREMSADFVLYFKTGSVFLVQSASTSNISGLSDLCGMSVAVQSGSTQEQDVENQNQNCSEQIDIISVSSYSDLVGEVSNGSADVGVYDTAILLATEREYKNQLKVVGNQYGVKSYGIAVNKKRPHLSSQFVNAINYMIRIGYYEYLLKQYSYPPATYGVCPSRKNIGGPSGAKKYAPSKERCDKLKGRN